MKLYNQSFATTSKLQEGDIVYDKSLKHFIIIELATSTMYVGKMLTHNKNYGKQVNLTDWGFDYNTYMGSEVKGSINNLKTLNKSEIELYARI